MSVCACGHVFTNNLHVSNPSDMPPEIVKLNCGEIHRGSPRACSLPGSDVTVRKHSFLLRLSTQSVVIGSSYEETLGIKYKQKCTVWDSFNGHRRTSLLSTL